MDEFIVISYIKKQRKNIMAFFLFSLVFYITFYFYQLPVESVLYATILCLVISSIIIIPDFISFTRKHKVLKELKNYITSNIEDLPDPKDIVEQDYSSLLRILFEENKKSKVLAENNNKDLVDYYTMWVHQIKTPIAALRLLLQSEQTNSSITLYPELFAELFKIEQYVEMVLSYLRMESMSSDLLLMRYSLDDIVKQAIRKYATLFIHKKIHLEFSELNCHIVSDEKWLVFVLEQVLSNALKYTKEGGSIAIFMDDTVPDTLVIADTGIGIEAEDLPRVFEKGFTGYNGRADKKSTGIGLYLSKRILAKLSHTIGIESEVGKGTRVKIGFDQVDMLTE